MRDAALGKFKSVAFCSLISEVATLTVRSHLCSYGNKSLENENVDSVETTSLSVSPSDVARGAVDARDIYVTQALWACQQDADGELKQRASRRLVGIMKDQTADEALFVGMAAPACADVYPMHLIQCQNKLLSECVEMTQTDCQSDLAHAVHEQCPASAHHHCAGGWDSFNMKLARVLRNLSESQRLLGKSTTQLEDLGHKRCADVCYMDACEVGSKCPGVAVRCGNATVVASFACRTDLGASESPCAGVNINGKEKHRKVDLTKLLQQEEATSELQATAECLQICVFEE
ncbi:unnamed protein product [Symbiodinium microadriaticum]|nr:unnamed protein product [Symbiodinium microadriaticum]